MQYGAGTRYTKLLYAVPTFVSFEIFSFQRKSVSLQDQNILYLACCVVKCIVSNDVESRWCGGWLFYCEINLHLTVLVTKYVCYTVCYLIVK